MTTLIQNEQKRQKIMARMREHLVPVLEHCRGGWVGLFLQGSQNYNLDYEGSDIDTKAIMLPSFSDFVLNAKPHPSQKGFAGSGGWQGCGVRRNQYQLQTPYRIP